MSRFRFRLDPLLNHRKEEERERAAELASARSAEDVERRREEDLRAVEVAGRALLHGAHRNGGPAGYLRNLETIVERVQEQAHGAEAARQAAEKRLVDSLRRYSDAAQARQVLERLRDRRERSWRFESGRREQDTQDDQAVLRHARER